jgi:release factor glutamine methyltransferase
VILANAPYVPTAEIEHLPTDFRDNEWRGALDGGFDGLDIHRRISEDALPWLRPGGRLLIEVAETQVASIRASFESGGLTVRTMSDDETVIVVGERPVSSTTGG